MNAASMTFCPGISLLLVCAKFYRRIGSMNGTNSSAKHYDMVVIGSGAAGHHGAILKTQYFKLIGRSVTS